MGAALALNLVAFRFLLRMPVSLLGFKLALPTQKQVDWRVVVGSVAPPYGFDNLLAALLDPLSLELDGDLPASAPAQAC